MKESAVVGTIGTQGQEIKGCSGGCITKDFQLDVTNTGVECYGHFCVGLTCLLSQILECDVLCYSSGSGAEKSE